MSDAMTSVALAGPQQNHTGGSTALSSSAVAYAAHGIHIFPCWWTADGRCGCGNPDCGSPGKHPIGRLVPNGVHDATNDLDTVTDWWTEHPAANIGIALAPNDMFVLDVDGPDGRAHLDELETLYDVLPETYQVVTGRTEGFGRHHVYRQPADGPRVGNAKLGHPKLETKGDGGYVIAPPSIHVSGRAYLAVGKWSQIVDAPAWLVALATKPTPTPAPTLPASDLGRDDLARRRLEGAAGKVALAPEGNRNNVLNWAAHTAGRLVGAGRLDRSHAEQTLLVAAARAGLAEAEARATVASGLDAGVDDPDYDGLHQTPPLPPVTTLSDAAGADGDDGGMSMFDDLVAQEVTRLLVREAAREQVVALQLEETPPPGLVRLDEFLAEPDPEVTYRIEGIWPSDGRCLLAAQYKAGKTTTVGNVLRSLVDGHPLFATYPVAVPDGGVVLLDDELHENTLRRWLRDQDIVNTDRIHVQHLRGRLSTFNILDAAVRTTWAERIRATGASVVILDCLRPIIDSLGLSEDKDVGKVLTAFDELLEEAGVSEGLIVHHMGHAGERSRGDSRLRDWPDAEWKLVREASEDGEDDPSAPRYFSAIGRDVEVTEQRLALVDGRRLEIIGGSRKAMKEWELVSKVIEAVLDQPGIAKRDVPSVVGGGRNKALDAVDVAIRDGYIEAARGGGLNPCVPAVPDYPRNGGTPPVTTLQNTDRSTRSDPPEHPRSAAPKGGRAERTGHDTPGTPPDSQEVPLP